MDAFFVDTHRLANAHVVLMSVNIPKRYFILREGRQDGPYTVAALREVGITPDTRVWDEEKFDWVAASTLAELDEVASRPLPPGPPRRLLAWLKC